MRRREFIRTALASGAAGSMARLVYGFNGPSQSTRSHNSSTPRSKIGYIREQIPSFEIPPYRGKRYEDNVPDTLEVVEQAKLGVRVLTSITDPEADYEMYGGVYFFRNPPIMWHGFGDWCLVCESLQEALPLLRIATGDSLNSQVDPVWMQVFLKCLGPDGLLYVPFMGRPWCRQEYNGAGKLEQKETGDPEEENPVWRPDGTTTSFMDESVTQLTCGEVCAGALPIMAVYYLRDKNPMWRQAAEQMIERLSEIAVRKDDYAYLSGAWEPNAKVSPHAQMPTGFVAAEWDGRMIQGLAQYYKVTGYEPALELAGKLNKFFRYHAQYYDAQARFLLNRIDKPGGLLIGGHGHAHALGLLCMLKYAMAADDRDTMEFVKASYEWEKKQNSSFGVSSLVGWFPEWFEPHYNACETCTVADMLALAVKLSEAGVGDYWDDADRWVRNQFTEAQLTNVDWVYRMAEDVAKREPRKPVHLPFETDERVVERNIGAWAGWSGGNEWAARMPEVIQHCCTGSASRALYYVWEYMVEHKKDELRVNLLLNRASRWADVYSYIPYQGQVDVKIKAHCRSVRVRAPEWVEAYSPQLVCKVNGVPRSLHWEGRYVNVGAVKPGDVVSVMFPIGERTVKERIGPAMYTLVVKGSTVVSIDPPGQNGPLYQNRDRYRKEQVDWRKLERFIPEEELLW